MANQNLFSFLNNSLGLQIMKIKWNDKCGDFPGCSVVKALPSSAEDVGSNPRWGAEIPYASWPRSRNIQQKQ